MINGKKRIKLAVVLFAMIFVVGAAFAATNGMLAFGGVVRINAVDRVARLEFTFAEPLWHQHWGVFTALAEVGDHFGTGSVNVLRFYFEVEDRDRFLNEVGGIAVHFNFKNTGDVPVRLVDVWGSTALPIYIRGNYTSTDIHHSPWNFEIIHPGEIIEGWVHLCCCIVTDPFGHGGHYEGDGWVALETYIQLIYEQAW